MDRCELCGKEIQEGIQYLVDFRRIHLGNKPWTATPNGHYAFCSECDKAFRLYLRWARHSQKIK